MVIVYGFHVKVKEGTAVGSFASRVASEHLKLRLLNGRSGRRVPASSILDSLDEGTAVEGVK